MITECTYCNEPLQEEEIEFFNTYIDEIPLCAQCLTL